mgnify:CR=1 FL=1
MDVFLHKHGGHLLILAAAYALGCVASGYYLVRWRTGKDIRDAGSGGTGATNAGRVLGRSGFLATLAADLVKGGLAVGTAWALGDGLTSRLLALTGVVAGHIWPFQIGFRGGKGIAPFLAALAVAAPLLMLVFGGIFGVAFLFLRRFTLAGLAAVTLLPAAAAWMPIPLASQALLAVTALLILIAHRRNLREEIAKFWPPPGGAPAPVPPRPPTDEHRTPHRL